MQPKTYEQVLAIVQQIKYKEGWDFRLEERMDGFLLQLRFMDTDIETGELALQSCRKFFVSKYSTVSEVIRTAFKSVEAAEHHEMCEKFKYRDVAIYNPHLDLDNLANFVQNETLDRRS